MTSTATDNTLTAAGRELLRLVLLTDDEYAVEASRLRGAWLEESRLLRQAVAGVLRDCEQLAAMPPAADLETQLRDARQAEVEAQRELERAQQALEQARARREAAERPAKAAPKLQADIRRRVLSSMHPGVMAEATREQRQGVGVLLDGEQH